MILSIDTVYQLERLSSRYSQIDRERSEPRTVHALTEKRPLNAWNFAQKFPQITSGVDAYYGTATFVPMADGARFAVSLSRDALTARPINDFARGSVGEWRQ